MHFIQLLYLLSLFCFRTFFFFFRKQITLHKMHLSLHCLMSGFRLWAFCQEVMCAVLNALCQLAYGIDRFHTGYVNLMTLSNCSCQIFPLTCEELYWDDINILWFCDTSNVTHCFYYLFWVLPEFMLIVVKWWLKKISLYFFHSYHLL